MSAACLIAPDLDQGERGRAISDLASALSTETRLLKRLAGILRDQRDGVAADDVQAVDDTVHAAQRVMLNVGVARRHRRELTRLLTGAEDLAIRDLDGALGHHMTAELVDSRHGLEAAAHDLSAEIVVNRQVLSRALRNGTEYVRALLGVPAPGTYAPEPEHSRSGRAPGLVNRRV